MTTPNIILIKRRLANSPLGTTELPLTAGELGFNEVNNSLYYGSASGVIDIAGSSYTKLSLTNTLTSNLQQKINDITLQSNVLTSLSSNLTNNIASVSSELKNNLNDFKNFTNNNFLKLSGGIINGNLTVTGDISSTGNSYFLNTVYTTTSAVSVVNVGNGTALYVANNGTGNIASFFDLDQNVEILHVGGNNSFTPNVGVKTSNPNVDFTVSGHISSSGTIFGSDITNNNLLKTNSISINNNKIFTDNYGNLVLNVTLSGNNNNKISNFIIDCGEI
jgi:hypothetical protein